MTRKPKTERVVTKLEITYEAPIFEAYNLPNGFLSPDTACHALFRYFLSAQPAWYEWRTQIILEGEKDIPEPNYRQIFSTWAQVYGVRPAEMTKYWTNVDMQCDRLGLPRMPEGDKFRFNVIPEVN